MRRAGCGRYGEQLPEDKLPGMHSVPKSAVLPYASGVGGLRWRLLYKSGLAVVVQRGGTLAKACFPGWRTWRRPRIIDRPFLLGGVREGIGNTLLLEGSSKGASPALRHVFLRGFGSSPEAHREGSGFFR